MPISSPAALGLTRAPDLLRRRGGRALLRRREAASQAVGRVRRVPLRVLFFPLDRKEIVGLRGPDRLTRVSRFEGDLAP